ncbi:MAG: hypothetical protein WCB61_06800 [Pseudolabrys sp.]
MPEAEVTFELKRAVGIFGANFVQLQLQVVARPALQKLTGCRLIREFQPVTVKRRSRWHVISAAQQLGRVGTVLHNPRGAFAANQLRQHVNCKLLDAVFLAARQIHGEMRDVQATGAIDEDKDSDQPLPEVIRPQASLTTLASILPSASNRFRGVVDTVPAYRADGRFSIAIATYQQISKKDRTQTADNVRSFDAYSQTVVVHLRNYL